MTYAILTTLSFILNIVWWIFLIMIIMSWLISFSVVNTRNQLVYQVWNILNALTRPVLDPIRRVVPNFGGLDISPIILFLIIIFIEQVIAHYIYPFVF